VTDREGLAVVAALIYWRPIVFGRHVEVFTDHNALRFLLTARNLRGRLARWATIVQEFQLTIRHRAGALHVVPDVLSRSPARSNLAAEEADESAGSASAEVEARLEQTAECAGALRTCSTAAGARRSRSPTT
jgi:hypothetical protein